MVVDVHVVESASGEITDMLSFYTLPSTILGHPEHNELRAAYMYYTGEQRGEAAYTYLRDVW
eukprot:360117-Chlamydomonas_euryale.AAC.17